MKRAGRRLATGEIRSRFKCLIKRGLVLQTVSTETGPPSTAHSAGEGRGVGSRRGSKAARSLRRMFKQYWPAVALVAAIILFWEVFVIVTNQPSYVLPPFHQIVLTVIREAKPIYLSNAWVTLQAVLAGFVIAATFGITAGTVIFHSKTLRRAVLPVLVSSQAVPMIAIAPLLIIWFGFGLAPKIIVAAVISFFPVTMNTLAGLAAADEDSIRLMRSLDASGWTTYRKVRFPAALPFMFAGLKTAAAICVIGAVVGEWVGAHSGLGPVMIAAHASFRTVLVFGAIVYLAAMGIGLFLFVTIVERLTIPWNFLSKN